MKFVIDACSAILLAKATLLETVFGTYDIQITKQAYEEIAEGKKEMFADALLVEQLNKEKRVKFAKAVKEAMEKLMKDFNMGKGEASAVAAAIMMKGAVITDNRQGRTAAMINGLPFLGSIEIVVDLHRKRRITKVKANEALETLKEEGWFEEYLIEKAKEGIK